MKNVLRILIVMVMMGAFAAITGCGSSSSSSGPDSFSCPGWNAGDTMTYLRTETVGTVSTSATMTWTVTERTADTAVLSSGTSTWTFTAAGSTYIPRTEEYVLSVDYGGTAYDIITADTYSSTTAFCPPPSVGARYDFSTFIPGPFEGTGEYVPATMTVTGRTAEPLSVPAGNFTATKLVLARTGGLADSTVTRYYANGIGVVKEVEEISSTNTTITKELTSYSFQ